MVHRYGCTPPAAENVCAYGNPTVPLNNGDSVVILTGGDVMDSVKARVALS
jgi:hypothetical protein